MFSQFFIEDLMPVYKKVTENISTSPPERVALDERFITLFLPEDAQERLRVIESRYQHKKSPGQAASRMGITRDALVKLEQSALKKLRTTLVSWQKGL
jgi:DNA-directed RNA polymerase specialized sigma subunit